jgi:predicted deacylase
MFHTSYAQARTQFLSAAHAVGAVLHSDPHPLKGCEGEDLALDVAVFGAANSSINTPKRVLLSSGVHGVEGYCGSGIQIAVLQNAALLASAQAAGITLIFAHAVNPHGFSFRRRATQENVDLNRNFQDFSKPLPVNADYDVAAPLLFPKVWPPDASNQAAIGALIALRGMPWLQQAISGGQYHDPQGIFYGGTAPTWSNGALRRLLATHCASAAQLAWIDLHTGLGSSGHGERMFGYGVEKLQSSDAASQAKVQAKKQAALATANAWWSNNGATPLTSTEDGTSVSAALTGTISDVGAQECPNTDIVKMTIEYGTVPPLAVLQAMRSDQWNQLHPQAPAALREANSQAMFKAFFTDTDEWKTAVVAQGVQAMQQAIDGLKSK